MYYLTNLLTWISIYIWVRIWYRSLPPIILKYKVGTRRYKLDLHASSIYLYKFIRLFVLLIGGKLYLLINDVTHAMIYWVSQWKPANLHKFWGEKYIQGIIFCLLIFCIKCTPLPLLPANFLYFTTFYAEDEYTKSCPYVYVFWRLFEILRKKMLSIITGISFSLKYHVYYSIDMFTLDAFFCIFFLKCIVQIIINIFVIIHNVDHIVEYVGNFSVI